MKFTSVLSLALAGIMPSMAYVPLAENIAVRDAEAAAAATECKCYPGDACWPNQAKWSALNSTVGGRLFVSIPPGAVCYPDYYGKPTANAAKCKEVAAQWGNSTWAANQQTLAMNPFWQNNTCQPNTATGVGGPAGCPNQCLQGFTPLYVIMAESANDIAAGVNFARNNKLRLVIRNTGHCFMGRSSGFGALAINTFKLKSIEFTNTYSGPGTYKGGAVKVGAGVMFQDLYPKAWSRNPPVDVLGGECPTVGLAGGFIQGGGQGPLSGFYGLGSDTALSFDVVLASGEKVTANSDQNTDLFWALKGGGMGTYGVVTSVTIKTFKAVPVTGISFNITGEAQGDSFWEGFRIWHTASPSYTAAGMYVWYASSNGLLRATFVAPNKTVAEFDKVVQPMFAKLRAANVTFGASPTKQFAKFGDLYNSIWVNDFHGSGLNTLWGGRLISQTDEKANGDNIIKAYRQLSAKYPQTFLIGGHLVNPGQAVPDPKGEISAVHPVWRNTADVNVYLYLQSECPGPAARKSNQDTVTYDIGNVIRAQTPNSAVYSNEGDINEPAWQDAFWGSQYQKLLKIKTKYDPNGVFWAKATPGSEKWVQINEQKLCKA